MSKLWRFLPLLFSLSRNASLVSSLDAFCGTNYFQASLQCLKACPTGEDQECHSLGSNYTCFYYTGCSSRIENGADADAAEPVSANSFAQLGTSNVSTNAPTARRIKTSRPTASPTPNPYLVSLNTATRKELNGKGASLTSFGFIFNLRTTAESAAMEIVGIDFLTASTRNLDFELYSTPGSFVGIKGNFGRWVLIGKGTVKGQGMGSLTSITSDLISPVPMDGRGSSRAFYLTLRTKDMIFRVAGSGSAADEMVQLASDEIEIYEGESVHAFPFPYVETDGAYLGPHQFIGAIHYDTVPCKPLEVQGTIYTLPCPIIPTASPVPSSSAPTTPAPTISRSPSFSPSIRVTPAPSYTPTTDAPTISHAPQASPTLSPLKSTLAEVNIVLTLRNTQNRNMTLVEEDDFLNKLLEFLFLHPLDGVLRVDDGETWYQQRVDWDESTSNERKLQESVLQDLASTAVTLVLRIAYYGDFSETELGTAVVDLIEENAQALVILLRGSGSSYFMQVDAIKAKTIALLTYAPVAAPDTSEEIQSAETHHGSNNGGVYAGIGSGIFACFLAVGLSLFLLRKRLHDRKRFQRGDTGDTRSLDLIDIESGQLQESLSSQPKFITPISDDESNDEVVEGQTGVDQNSQASKQSHSNDQDETKANHGNEETLQLGHSKIRANKKQEKAVKFITATDRVDDSDSSRSTDSDSESSSSTDSSSSASHSTESPRQKEKNPWETVRKSLKGGDIVHCDTDLEPSQCKRPRAKDTVNSKSTPERSDRWKHLSKAVKAGDITRLENYPNTLQGKRCNHPSPPRETNKSPKRKSKLKSTPQKKDHWDSLSYKLNEVPRDQEAEIDPKFKSLRKSANSDSSSSNAIKTSRHKTSSEVNLHNSESNLNEVAKCKSGLTSQKKDHWKILREDIQRAKKHDTPKNLRKSVDLQRSNDIDQFKSLRKSTQTTSANDPITQKSLRKSIDGERSNDVDQFKALRKSTGSSDSNPKKTSHPKPVSKEKERLHSLERNPTSQKKDHWRNLRQSMEAGDIRRSKNYSSDSKHSKHKSRSVQDSALDAKHLSRRTHSNGVRSSKKHVYDDHPKLTKKSSPENLRRSSCSGSREKDSKKVMKQARRNTLHVAKEVDELQALRRSSNISSNDARKKTSKCNAKGSKKSRRRATIV